VGFLAFLRCADAFGGCWVKDVEGTCRLVGHDDWRGETVAEIGQARCCSARLGDLDGFSLRLWSTPLGDIIYSAAISSSLIIYLGHFFLILYWRDSWLFFFLRFGWFPRDKWRRAGLMLH
jgi:hypothetical protein